MKLLYIGTEIQKVDSGASLINYRNFNILKSIFGNDFVCLEPEHRKRFGYLYDWGGDKDFLNKLTEKLYSKHFDYIFLSQSLLGLVAKKIKEISPNSRVICFFHNIEVQYAKEYIRTSGVSHLPFYLSAKLAETRTVTYSDYCVVLNERDAHYLREIYNKQADLVLPTTFEDHFEGHMGCREVQKTSSEFIYLFVGVAFFANIQGIEKFIHCVLPHIPGRLVVVGKGMDEYKQKFCSLCDRVEVHGFVDSLSKYYNEANFVVSPIFSGGGMKTKTAEALMYGKTIIGTKEAFEGYVVDERAMKCADTIEEFIIGINNLIQQGRIDPLNLYSRNLFVTHYSNAVAKAKIEYFFSNINC